MNNQLFSKTREMTPLEKDAQAILSETKTIKQSDRVLKGPEKKEKFVFNLQTYKRQIKSWIDGYGCEITYETGEYVSASSSRESGTNPTDDELKKKQTAILKLFAKGKLNDKLLLGSKGTHFGFETQDGVQRFFFKKDRLSKNTPTSDFFYGVLKAWLRLGSELDINHDGEIPESEMKRFIQKVTGESEDDK